MNKKNAFYSGLFFGTAMTVFFCFQNGIVSGLIAGPTAGVLFGACMYWFVNSKMISKQTSIDGEVEGDVLYSGPANHYLNGEAAGGKLYLLGDKLFFKSHKLNIQKHELVIELHHIASIVTYNIFGIIRTGLEIKLDNGKTEKFVVNNREKWMEEINTVKGSLLSIK